MWDALMKEVTSVVHSCPPGDEQRTPCCGRPVLEVGGRITLYDGLVTCGRAATYDNLTLELYTRGAVDAAERAGLALPPPEEILEGFRTWQGEQLP